MFIVNTSPAQVAGAHVGQRAVVRALGKLRARVAGVAALRVAGVAAFRGAALRGAVAWA